MDTIVDTAKPDQFMLAFMAMWITISYVLSVLRGWWRLATWYKGTPVKAVQKWRGRSASLRLVSYGSCLNFSVSQDGLGVSVFFLFRAGHPPLLVPWSEIVAEQSGFFIFRGVKLTFAREPGIKLKIGTRLARQIHNASRDYWKPAIV